MARGIASLLERWKLGTRWRSALRNLVDAAPWKNLDIVLSTIVLLGIGPVLQLIIDASLSQRRDTLYESAFGDYMIKDTPLVENYISLYTIPFIFCGIAISYLSKGRSFREFSLIAAISAFAMWTLYDEILGRLGFLMMPNAFPNFGYNLIGSILFGLSLYLVILITRYAVRSRLKSSIPLRGFVALSISLFFSLLVTGITSFFLKPIPISFQTTLEPITGVYFLPYKGDTSFEPSGYKWEGKEFRSPFPDTPISKDVTISGERLAARFDVSEDSPPYVVKIWLFSGCTFRDIGTLDLKKPHVEEAISGQISLSSGSGFSNWSIVSEEKMSLVNNTTDHGAFWIELNNENLYRDSTYIADGKSIDITSRGNLLIGASSLGAKESEGGIVATPVHFSIKNGNIVHSFSLTPEGPIDGQEAVNCAPVSEEEFRASVSGTVIMAIQPAGAGRPAEIKSTLTSKFAYVSANSIETADIADAYLGVASVMGISGKPPKLEVKHALPSLAERGDGMIVQGKFDVRTTHEGRIRLSGYATRLWKGDVRVSPTRWESLSDEWQRWLLAGAAAILLAALRFISPILWRNRNRQLI